MEVPFPWLREPLEKLMRWRRRLATGVLVLVAAALGAHVLLGENGLVSYHHKRAEYHSLQQQLQNTQEENHRLDKEIRALKTDPKAIERVAREQWRFAKPGEVIYVLPDQPGDSSPQPTAGK